MKWETPAFVEINMSAEIGGYQSDFSDRDPRDPIVEARRSCRRPPTATSRSADPVARRRLEDTRSRFRRGRRLPAVELRLRQLP